MMGSHSWDPELKGEASEVTWEREDEANLAGEHGDSHSSRVSATISSGPASQSLAGDGRAGRMGNHRVGNGCQ